VKIHLRENSGIARHAVGSTLDIHLNIERETHTGEAHLILETISVDQVCHSLEVAQYWWRREK
jgi:hypothetical protein